jgi:hypothetical protein
MTLDYLNATLGAVLGIVLSYIVYAFKRGIIQAYIKYYKKDLLKGVWYHYYYTFNDNTPIRHQSIIKIEAGFLHNYKTKSYAYNTRDKEIVESTENQTASGYIDSFNNQLLLTTRAERFEEIAHIVFQRQLLNNRDDIIMIGFSLSQDNSSHLQMGTNILSAKPLNEEQIQKKLDKINFYSEKKLAKIV